VLACAKDSTVLSTLLSFLGEKSSTAKYYKELKYSHSIYNLETLYNSSTKKRTKKKTSHFNLLKLFLGISKTQNPSNKQQTQSYLNFKKSKNSKFQTNDCNKEK
jgi:hypothetical protein